MSDGAFDLLQAQRAVFRSSIRAPEKLIALALLDHWSRGTETFPSVQRLAAWSSLDRTAVMRALQGLERQGAIVVKRQKGVPNRYALGQLSLLPVAESDRSPVASGPAPVAESDGLETGAKPEPVVESDQSSATTSRSERLPPVALSDLTSRSERHEGTQEGTQTRNPLENTLALEGSPTEGAPKRSGRSKGQAPAKLVPIPDDFQPTESHRAFAAKHGIDLELEVIGFKGHYENQRVASPNGRFTTWLTNQAKWNKQRRSGGRNGPVVVQHGGNIRQGDTSWLEESVG